MNWAEKKLAKKEIYDFLKISRTIGGHIFFPRGVDDSIKYRYSLNDKSKVYPITLNTARGGKHGYYDIFDKTLFAIKQFYAVSDLKQLEKEIKSKLKNEYVIKAFMNYAESFNLWKKGDCTSLEAFKAFVDFFSLNDFVDENYEIYDLTSFNEKTKLYGSQIRSDDTAPIENYRAYVAGTNHAIQLCTNRLLAS
ncbi:hypothetical protein F8249_08395 [Lactococcus lactis subsp. lactis]|nr:hypothetical protein [Lactococcus lactis]MBG1279282.1 hypothetical protein [Lactococcus lactis subsp. lactis]